MHKILSQVEILGSPIMLGSSLISGLSTFLAEPAKARNPTEFARGVGTGSVTLVKMASFGILTFIGQVSCRPNICSCPAKSSLVITPIPFVPILVFVALTGVVSKDAC